MKVFCGYGVWFNWMYVFEFCCTISFIWYYVGFGVVGVWFMVYACFMIVCLICFECVCVMLFFCFLLLVV